MMETNLMKLTQCHGPWSYSSATRRRERNKSLLRTTEKKSISVRISIMNGNKIVERTQSLLKLEEFYKTVYTSSRHKLNCDNSLAGYVWFICLISNGVYTTGIAGTHCSNMNWSMDPHCQYLYQRHASSTSSYPCPKWLPNSQSLLLWYSMGVGA